MPTPKVLSRAAWHARAARAVTSVAKSKRKLFVVHYSAASPDQTPRAIQDYHMDVRGWSDIGYNWLVSSLDGTVYAGRGWDVLGAHVAGHNTEAVGVCVIGLDREGRKDVSDAARESVRWLYDQSRGHFGRKLTVKGHRDLAATTCPGNELYAWLAAGLPAPSGPATAPNWTEDVVEKLPTIRLGEGRAAPVHRCQSLLNAAPNGRAGIPEDGVFGPKTDTAVRAFQVRENVPNSVTDGRGDGIVGPKTWTALLLG